MYIDTHAHIYLDKFKADLSDVIKRSTDAKVLQILLPNIDTDTIEDVFKCNKDYLSICRPMVGLHPCSVSATWEKDLEILERYFNRKGIIGIGEIGIDLYWDSTFKSEQIEAFEYQIQMAMEKTLPIVIHSRNAIDLTIKAVAKYQNGSLRGVFHCFDQSWDHAKRIMDLGFYMGIGGIVTYKKNNALREVVRSIPLTSVLLETDSPYLPPVPYRGKRNESSYIPIIAQKLAEIHNTPISTVAEVTSQNAKKLFEI